MALIICSECGKEFSDKAPACPNCGCPTEIIKQEINNAIVDNSNIKTWSKDKEATTLREYLEQIRLLEADVYTYDQTIDRLKWKNKPNKPSIINLPPLPKKVTRSIEDLKKSYILAHYHFDYYTRTNSYDGYYMISDDTDTLVDSASCDYQGAINIALKKFSEHEEEWTDLKGYIKRSRHRDVITEITYYHDAPRFKSNKQYETDFNHTNMLIREHNKAVDKRNQIVQEQYEALQKQDEERMKEYRRECSLIDSQNEEALAKWTYITRQLNNK